jgi:prepilin-type processing-associated H-X9-DG protein
MKGLAARTSPARHSADMIERSTEVEAMVHDCGLDRDPGALPSRTSRRPWWMSTWGLMKAIFALGCGLGLLILLFDLFSEPIPRRSICVNNLKQIALALHNYRERYGSFPPAFIADATGRPIHSWRVLILPFLEQEALYDQYDFREPWDGPNNTKLIGKMPQFFACPWHWHDSRSTKRTNYAAITGPGTMFPGTASVKIDQVADGTSSTLMVTEVEHLDIPWTAPFDLDARTMSLEVNDPEHPCPASQHRGGVNVAMVDGSVHFMPRACPPNALRALITIAGGEKIDVGDAFYPARPRE